MPRNEQDPIYAVLWSLDHKQVFTASYDKSINSGMPPAATSYAEFKAAPDPKPVEPKKEEKKGASQGGPQAGCAIPGKPREKRSAESQLGPPGHRDQVFSMALTKDGKFLATGSSDKTLKLLGCLDRSGGSRFP